MLFVRRDPNHGYYGRQLWLPKQHINTMAVKAGLEFPVMGPGGFSYIQLWEDVGEHLVVPREFVPRKELGQFGFPIISTAPPPPPPVHFKSRIVLDAKLPGRTLQHDAATAMIQSTGGLLNLACGKGKTVLALYLISQRQTPTLVIVNNTTLINQWREQIEKFLEVPG